MTRRPRRGAVLAVVLVSLLVLALLSASLLQLIVLQQRQSRTELQQWQAFWLAESALQRAERLLRQNPDESIPVWRVELPDRTGRPQIGAADTLVEPLAEGQVRLVVVARWPDAPMHRVQVRRELILELPPGASL